MAGKGDKPYKTGGGGLGVQLVDVDRGGRSLTIDAQLQTSGELQIHGYDISSTRGDYEWYTTVAAEDVPRALEVLGGEPDAHIIDVLAERWTGPKARAVEETLKAAGINLDMTIWRSLPD